MPVDPAIDHLPAREVGTSALLEYAWASACDFRMLHFVIDTTLAGDYAVHVLQQALDGKDDYKSRNPTSLARSEPGKRTQALRASRQELLEMFLNRAVDNFQVYLVDAIRVVLHKQPRVLADRKLELSLGYILKFDSIDALAKEIVEGKLQSLSYQGFGELVLPEAARPQLVEYLALRNIVVHNRGRIDERYMKAVPNFRGTIGIKRTIDVDDLLQAFQVLDNVVSMTDTAIADKFSLPQTQIRLILAQRSLERWGTPSTPGEVDA